jgi:hypothetical protein
MIKKNGEKLTQKEAWLLLQKEWTSAAEEVEKYGGFPAWVRCEGDVPCCGLQGCIYMLGSRGQITRDTWKLMIAKLDKKRKEQTLHDKERCAGYLFPCTEEGAKQKANLCAVFAERCQS